MRWACRQSIWCHSSVSWEAAPAQVAAVSSSVTASISAIICFASLIGLPFSFVPRDQMEVCVLSHGVMSPIGSTPIPAMTAWPSLPPSSYTRRPVSVPCGSLSLPGGRRAYHVPRPYRNGVGSAYSPVALVSAIGDAKAPIPGHVPFGPSLQHLGLAFHHDV